MDFTAGFTKSENPEICEVLAGTISTTLFLAKFFRVPGKYRGGVVAEALKLGIELAKWARQPDSACVVLIEGNSKETLCPLAGFCSLYSSCSSHR